MAYLFRGVLFARSLGELIDQEFVAETAQYYAGRKAETGRSPHMIYLFDIAKEIDTHFGGDLYIGQNTWINPDALEPLHLWGEDFLETSVAMAGFRNRYLQRNNAGNVPWRDMRLQFGDLFGADKKSTLSKFLRFAETPPEEALPTHVAPRMMFYDFARRIREGRLNQ